VDKADKQFFLTFLGVTAALIFITIVVLVAAVLIGAVGSPDEKSAAQIKLAAQRIQPVGRVNLKSNPAQPVAPVVAAPAATPASAADQDPGGRIYASVCQACHMTGAGGAPVVGNIEAWAPRIAQGVDVLYASSLNGKGVMPPKGGNPGLSDAEVKAAVDYMVKQSKR
jgi:cytochrome c5